MITYLVGSILSCCSCLAPGRLQRLYQTMPFKPLWNRAAAAYFGVRFQRSDSHSYIIEPSASRTKFVLFYLHGGAYLWCDHSTHIVLLCQLCCKLQCKIVVYDYPLLSTNPKLTVSDQIAHTVHQYRCLRIPTTMDVVVAGDSAGGGLAINLTRRLGQFRYVHTKIPTHLVLLSPWTDLHGGLPDAVCPDDYLTTDLIRRWAQVVRDRGFHDECDISPARIQDFRDFPPILVVYGRAEVLTRQIHEFAVRVRQRGGTIREAQFEEMPHCFPLVLPFAPQTQLALEVIHQFHSGHVSPYRCLSIVRRSTYSTYDSQHSNLDVDASGL